MNIHANRIVFILLPLFFLFFSCKTASPPKKEFIENQYLSSDFYKELPIDIAIVPVKDQTLTDPNEYVFSNLRRAVYEELLQKRYSVISLGMIDDVWSKTSSKVILDEDALRGVFDEDAILFITLTQWDTTWFRTHNKILTGANLSLLKSKSGEKMWRVEVRDLFFNVSGEVNIRNFDDCQKRIIKRFAKKVTDSIPVKENR